MTHRQLAPGSYEEARGHLGLRPLSENLAAWQALLRTCPGATLYHREAWIELLSRAHRLSMWLATLERDGATVAGAVFARSPNPFVRRFVALPFSDSCPPLARSAEAAHSLLDALAGEAGRDSAYEIRGIGGRGAWERVDCFVNWRLDLRRSLGALERGLDANFRRNLRRARSAIKVERGSAAAHLRRFYALQLDSRRHFGMPPQPLRFFELAHELFGPANFDIWIASESGEDVAGAIYLRDGDAVHFKWGARRAAYRSSANHVLVWNAIEEYALRAGALDLGRADIRNLGLMRFKHGLGAVAAALPYSFFPMAPRQVSPEILTGAHKVFATLWSRLPIFATRALGRVVYRFLA